jgi:hypothetical protein
VVLAMFLESALSIRKVYEGLEPQRDICCTSSTLVFFRAAVMKLYF